MIPDTKRVKFSSKIMQHIRFSTETSSRDGGTVLQNLVEMATPSNQATASDEARVRGEGVKHTHTLSLQQVQKDLSTLSVPLELIHLKQLHSIKVIMESFERPRRGKSMQCVYIDVNSGL